MNNLETRSLLGLAALYASRMLGLFMVLPVLSLFATDYQGSSTLLLGFALGVYGLSQALLQIPLGMLSDKIGRKAVIAGGMLVFLFGSVVAANADTITMLIIGRFLQGAGAVASTIMALLSDLTTEENRTKAMAAVGGSIGASFAIAMIVGPIIADIGGLALIFWITAGLAILGILLVAFYIPSPQIRSQVAASEALTMPKMLAKTLANKELLRLDFGVFVLHLIQMASWVSVPFLLQATFHFGLEKHWWLYLTTMGLGFVAMLPMVIIGERKRKLKMVFTTAIALLVLAGLLLFNAGSSLAWFAFGLFVFFMAFNLLEAVLPSLVSKISPSGSRGTAMGIYSSSQFLGTFIGGVAGGYAAYRFGHESVFLFCSAIAAVWFVVALTMAAPKFWSTVVVDLATYGPLDTETLMGIQKTLQQLVGVEDLTAFPDRQLLYLKVNRDKFDRLAMDGLLKDATSR